MPESAGAPDEFGAAGVKPGPGAGDTATAPKPRGGPAAASKSEHPGLPPALAQLARSTGKNITSSDAQGGLHWKVVKLKAGDVFEAFGWDGKTSFKWMARVPEENWEWAQRGNQLVPTWYNDGGSTVTRMVRYRITLKADAEAAMSKVANQHAAMERLGPAKFQYFSPEGFEHNATIERLEVVEVLLPLPSRTLGPGSK
jgi:hypothetical protein